MSAEIIPLGKPGYTMVRVTPDEKRILEYYRAASEEGKRKIMAMLKLLGFVRRRLTKAQRAEMHEALAELFLPPTSKPPTGGGHRIDRAA